MKPADDKEEVLFREAIQRAKDPEREAVLEQACAGNQALRGRLEALRLAHESVSCRPPETTNTNKISTTNPAP